MTIQREQAAAVLSESTVTVLRLENRQRSIPLPQIEHHCVCYSNFGVAAWETACLETVVG